MSQDDGGLDDCELLRRMADNAGNLSARREAWGVFYGRHAEYVRRSSLRAHSTLIGPDQVRDAVHDTFLRAYQRAGTFELIGASAENQRKAVRAWLFRINENIIRDYFRNTPMVLFVEDSELEEHLERAREGTAPQPDGPSDAKVAVLEQGLNGLTDREQRVLRETAFWYVPGLRQQRMPHAAMQRLANDLNTTPANIRQLRARAMEKLKKYVLERCCEGQHEKDS